MKKFLMTLMAGILLLVLTGCDYDLDLASHPNRAYIEDFEYMLEILMDNFPYFGVAEREFGAQVERIAETTRRALITGGDVRDSAHFRQILQANFFSPFRHIGHLSIQDRATLHLILGNIYRGPINYNGQFVDMQGRVYTYWGQKFVDVARGQAAQQFYGLIEVALGYEVGMVRPNNLTTLILAENVAYVRVNEFWHYNIEHDKAIMRAFYEEIQGMEHLVIDLRANGGGFTRYFVQLFMAPNLAYDTYIPGIHTLLMGGERNMAWLDVQIDDDRVFAGVYTDKQPLPAYRFPYLRDADIFDYLITRPVRIEATGEMLFDGKIWILVDERTASAAEYAAMYAMLANFATVVGSPTRGVTGGGLAAFVPLPNTGLVIRYDFGFFIDSYGRAIDEYGAQPNYLNLPNMDALQTVMYLINR
ncbi:MAG: S41 family peptidase [Defluviitaleaceae bacterium]|nr:S41 family peptidase [Defluviitaleaceae bacterium]